MLNDFGEISVDLGGFQMWIPHLVLPIAFLLAAYRTAENYISL